jgi:hypothetical protein
VTSLWFSLGDDAEARHRRYVEEYLAIDPALGPLLVDAASVRSADALLVALGNAEAAGFDEVVLVPTTADEAELDRLELVLDQR